MLQQQKQHKTSHGSGKFSRNLHTSRNLWYNKRNCKSVRHGRQHTFMQHKSRTKFTTTNNLNPDLKSKSRKNEVTKYPPPQRQDQMFCAICCCKSCQDNNKNDQYILSYNEPDLYNDYISKEQSSFSLKIIFIKVSYINYCIGL